MTWKKLAANIFRVKVEKSFCCNVFPIMRSSNTQAELIERLQDIGSATVRPWHRIGVLLDEVDSTEAWVGSADNFTSWMRQTAPVIGLKESSLWRFLRSSRIYRALSEDLAARGHAVPDLDELPSSVSAESLELFDKLRRAAPARISDPIALRLVRGEVSRDELRTLWQDYRPALVGRTAQGRGVAAPKVDSGDPGVAKSLAEAEALLALRRGARDWTGDPSPDVYEVFSRIRMPAAKDAGQHFMADIVVATRKAGGSPLEFHLFEVKHRLPRAGDIRWLEQVSSYVDYVWLAVAQPQAAGSDARLPEGVGLLEITSTGAVIRRQAARLKHGGRLTGELAKELLASLPSRR